MASNETILTREDGSQARILVLDFTSPWSTKPDYEVCVFKRATPEENWTRVLDTPERREKAKTMEMNEFLESGRNPIFYVVSFGELFRATQHLHEKYTFTRHPEEEEA